MLSFGGRTMGRRGVHIAHRAEWKELWLDLTGWVCGLGIQFRILGTRARFSTNA
jgi:hypothetical protein